MKLSPAQRALLTDAIKNGHAACAETYPPAKKLVDMGLAVRREGRFGYGFIEPTDAGRQALSSGQGTEK